LYRIVSFDYHSLSDIINLNSFRPVFSCCRLFCFNARMGFVWVSPHHFRSIKSQFLSAEPCEETRWCHPVLSAEPVRLHGQQSGVGQLPKQRHRTQIIDRNEMKFSDKFIAENRQGVLRFLLNEGAEMSRLFYDCTDREDAFRRIVQAELLGNFHTLKYFSDDLEKELSYPVDRNQQFLWQENTSCRAGSLTATEEDDFYTTLRLGELSKRTCLSYWGGMHMECLLSGYDSNKKILLARRGGEVLGRAVIQPTKGTFYAP